MIYNSNLIFDLGMNDGRDTEYYLKKGYKVIAVEANPYLCQEASLSFSEAIDQKRLVIVHAAISSECCNSIQFFINIDNTYWSSLDKSWASRDGTRFYHIHVKSITINWLFERFGIPLYLKVDVEGADSAVISQLCNQKYLPVYVSIEDCRFGYDYISTLISIGYKLFKLSDQSKVSQLYDASVQHQFMSGSSGPFGEDLEGSWLNYPSMITHYSTTVRTLDGFRIAPKSQWWDIHAKLG
ncbi:FkbM family methyltransferase [Prochlorothrix hollandica]|uniref:FkbM family methyltransferase n=1 Tax=Prochlorothrix hollandica TaxID=1223 RepID=UPI0009DA4171|nr:FkbM family methyltransferase [Prochlorothrix hollandica]